MRAKRRRRKKKLFHTVAIRLTQEQYLELFVLLSKSPYRTMSALVRQILFRQPLVVHTRDRSLQDVMEELSRVRTELRAMGVNINQMTKRFHTADEPSKKLFFAKVAFQEYQRIDSKVDELLIIVAQLSKKWLSA